MITVNPFSELSEWIPSFAIQAYVILMFILVVGGTIIDTLHKKSAEWFFKNSEEAKKSATRKVQGAEKAVIALQVATQEVLLSAEFDNKKRRLSHLFTMYGFLLFVITSVIMVFVYPGSDATTPTIFPLLWHLGALSLCFGGYWFWFSIRVDVAAEGVKWYHLERADLFIVSLLTMATFGLIWSYLQWANIAVWETVFFGLFLLASTVLFAGVLWSKFAHMFFKPMAAYQKRMTKADGSFENLPTVSRDDPEQRKRHSMELLVDAPMDMGPGIKREEPNHY
jgi:hypothetical protein